jgi:hypothetical protein
MWGDMDPKNWGVGEWAWFLFRILTPTILVTYVIVSIILQ